MRLIQTRLGTILPLTVVKFPEKDSLDNVSSLSLLSGYTHTDKHGIPATTAKKGEAENSCRSVTIPKI